MADSEKFKEKIQDTVSEQHTEEDEYAVLVNGNEDGAATAVIHAEDSDIGANAVLTGILKLIKDMDEEAVKQQDRERGDVINAMIEGLAEELIEARVDDLEDELNSDI